MFPRISYSLISTFRKELMGIAILWIFLFHSKIFFPAGFLFHPLRFLVSTGYGGVDLFFFLSGFGLMHHMETKYRSSSSFYKKRFITIYPSYFIATITTLVIDYFFFHNISWQKIILCLTTTGFWLNNSSFYWFIPAIAALYIAFPLFYKYYLRHNLILVILLTAASVSTSVALVLTDNNHFIKIIARIPIFLIGSHINYISLNTSSTLTKKDISLQITSFLLSFGTLLLLLLLSLNFDIKKYGLAYYIFTVGTLPLSLFIAIVLDTLSRMCTTGKNGLLFLLLSTCGTHSLEIYLIHKQIVFKVGEIFLANIPLLADPHNPLNYGHYLEYIFYFIMTLFLALPLHKLSAGIRSRINPSEEGHQDRIPSSTISST